VFARRCEVREPEPHADVACVEGPYSSYKEDLRKRKGVDADQPHRIAYKRLVRA
jgi:sulfate-transporting ATPase